MQTGQLVGSYMRTIFSETEGKNVAPDGSSPGGLLPPSRLVPTLQKGCRYRLCPCDCTWGEKRSIFICITLQRKYEPRERRQEWNYSLFSAVLDYFGLKTARAEPVTFICGRKTTTVTYLHSPYVRAPNNGGNSMLLCSVSSSYFFCFLIF